MKKIYTFITVIAVLFTASTVSLAQSCDTLRNYTEPAGGYTTWTSSGGLLLGQDVLNDGTNNYNTDVWAEPYNVGGITTQVRGVRILPWKIQNNSGSASLTIQIYNNNAGVPGTVIGSQVVNYSDLNPEMYWSTIEFNTPVSVTGQFYVGYKVSFTSPVDSFALATTQPATDYTMFHLSGAGTFNNEWLNISEVYSAGGSPINSAFALDVLTSTSAAPSASFTVDNTAACLNGTFGVDASGSTGTTDFYQWYLTEQTFTDVYDSGTGVSISLNPTMSTPSNQYIALFVDGGCITDIAVLPVTVHPNVTATVSSADASCGGNNGSITITAPAGGTGTYSYSIDGGVTMEASGTFNNLAAGTYNVEVHTNGTNCEYTTTVVIGDTPLDDASFNYASSTICEGSANVTPASVTTPGGTFTSTTGLIFADASTGEIDIAGSTAGTYVVTYTTAGTCPDESTQTITITNAPDATFTYAAADYCTTGTNPSPTVTGTIGAFSSTPAGLVISSSTGVITLATSTPGTYDVTNTIAASGSCPASSETVQVTITEAGDASFTYAASAYCLSGANPTPAITGTAGTFSSTTGLSVDAVTGEIDLTNSTPGTYTVTNELPASGTCPVISATTQITITASPDASFTYAETAYCSTGTASPVVTGTAGTFTATPSGLSINGSTGVIDLANSTAGTYTVINTIAATAACAEETETFTVTIEALPAATVSLSGITLTAQETGVTYQWINCAGNTPVAGETSQTFTPSVPGSYAVIVTSGNCSATSACQAVSNVGLEDNSIEVVAVYPNPAEHIITISGLTASNATVSVLDVNGRVLTSEVTSSAKVELSVRDFEAGIYLIKVESETINGTKRFIKK